MPACFPPLQYVFTHDLSTLRGRVISKGSIDDREEKVIIMSFRQTGGRIKLRLK